MGNKSYSKAISWISDCRIGFEDRQNQQKIFANNIGGVYKETNSSKNEYVSVRGRFPANILISDDMLNDGVVSKSGNNKIRSSDGFNKNAYGIGIGVKVGDNNGEYGDKGSNSRYYDIDKWFEQILND